MPERIQFSPCSYSVRRLRLCVMRSSRRCNIQPSIQHLAIEAAGKRHRVAYFLELETEAALAARQERDLEQRRLYSLVIEPGPHLCHRSDEVNATAPNLDNVQESPRQSASFC